MNKKKKFNDTDEWFALIPELKAWNNGRGIDHETWVVIEGRIELALAYSSIFWPEFILFKDCIFRGEMSEKIFDDWYKNCKGNLMSIEATVNHWHLEDTFKDNVSKEQYLYLGKVLKSMWKANLITRFPDRQITIDFDEDNYIITIYQELH